jgi:methionyl-tRNA formyltransferase
LRLLFFGTPDFAVASLEALAAGPHDVVGIVSQPDRPRGRGRALEPTPVGAAARALGLPLLQPEKAGHPDAVAWMAAHEPELGCVVAFGQYLTRAVRQVAPHGLINAHASLLPRYRGAAPIAHAVLAGETRTGITIIRVARQMDAGDWCLERELAIGPEETAGELAERLSRLAAEALVQAVDQIARGTADFRAQRHELATPAPKLEPGFGRLDWGETAERVLCRIRAATPRPGAWLELARSGRRLRILRARLAAPGPHAPAAALPGRVRATEDRLLIAALDGWVEVLRLQVPGRRPLDAAEFLRGARVPEDEEVSPS